ncbi:MAG: sugar transferase [Chloroflexota bacterium]
MLRRFTVNFAIFSILLDFGSSWLALSFANYIRPLMPALPFLVQVDEYSVPQPLYLIIPLAWIITFLFSSVYDPKRNHKVVDEVQVVFVASSFATLLCAGILYLAFRDFSRWLLITFSLANIVFVLLWRSAFRIIFRFRKRPSQISRVLIVGAGVIGQNVKEMVNQYGWSGLQFVGFLDDDTSKQEQIDVLGQIEDVSEVIENNGIDDVVIALPQRAFGEINHLVSELHNLPVNVRVIPDYFSLALYRASVSDFGGIPMINLRDPALNDVQRLVKRIFDLILSTIMLLSAAPVYLIIAIMVRLDSNGPILFPQERLGENGRIFRMYKFRTMIVGAEALQEEINELNEDGKIIFKRRDDPRITKVGRFLRRTSLDELPQLLNVVKGEMSLVGPRPELPWMVEQYEPWQHKRFAVPQGMTGWWQVNGRSDKPMHLHTDDDIFYVQNYSIWMDIYILIKTPWIVLRGNGAY